MRLRTGAATDTGRVRETNEDSFLSNVEDGLFVVCDGMGGAASGEVASQLAVQTIQDHLNKPADADGTGQHHFRPHTFRLAEAVRVANRSIYDQAKANSSQSGMGTTMVGVWIDRNIAGLAHVGDSRAYLWRNDVLEAVTTDHSLVEAQVKAGLINREQSLQSEHQNILLRALGREPIVDVELAELPVQSGDCLLLCSDGLTRMVPDAAIAEALAKGRGDPQRICNRLVAAANEAGGADNVTVLVVEVAGSRLGEVFRWWRRSG